MTNQTDNDLETLVGALVLLRKYATAGSSLRELIEDSFQRPIVDIEQEIAREIEYIG